VHSDAGRRNDRSPRQSLVKGEERPQDRTGSSRQAQERPVAPGHELIYGRNGVTETLKGNRDVFAVMIADGVRMDDRMRRIQALAGTRRIPIDFVPRQLLDELTTANHQGVVLEAGSFRYADLDDIRERPGTVLIFDHLQDPQNFGTLIRTAAAAGASGIIIPENRAADVTPAVVNASAGAVELIPVAVVPNLNNALKALKARGWWAAALDTGDDAIDIQQGEIPDPVALIIGSEGDGVSPLLRKNCDLILSIPMVGSVESLNAATAGSIAVYELLRRQRSRIT
jgi:23S rRNA (guanosine2251-2'-O)-methyltransferase